MKLKKIINKVKYLRSATFNNRLPLHVNFLHYTYDKLNRLKHRNDNYQKFANTDAIVRNINEKGFHLEPGLVPADLVNQIKAKIDKIYADETNPAVNRVKANAGLLRIENCFVNVPECEQLYNIPEVKAALHAFYGGNYRAYNADIYRLIAKTDNSDFASDRWHFDNVSKNQLKLMLYFTDVSADTGAMRVVDKKTSQRIRGEGFVKRHKVKKFQKEIDEACIPLEGPAGTGAFFQPQYCIHRAVEPQRDLRDVMVLMIYPHWDEVPLDEKEKSEIIKFRSYVSNPYKWTGI